MSRDELLKWGNAFADAVARSCNEAPYLGELIEKAASEGIVIRLEFDIAFFRKEENKTPELPFVEPLVEDGKVSPKAFNEEDAKLLHSLRISLSE